MVIVYRGMKPDPDHGDQPMAADGNGNALGVRSTGANPDVVTYEQNRQDWVAPQHQGEPQGISVAVGSGCNLPRHRRPKGAPWNGTGAAGLLVWQLDSATLTPSQLAAVAAPILPDQPDHYVVSPGQDMPLASYQGYVKGTVGHWTLAPDPDPACAIASLEGAAVEPHLVQLAAGVAAGDDPAELVGAIVGAKRAGAGREDLIVGIESEVARAEAAGDDDGAERLRGVLDRLTGWCAPSSRIELT
jgi:hypothetical protein